MNDVVLDLASAIARDDLVHGLGASFARLELAGLGVRVDCSIGESEDCAPAPTCAPDAQLAFGAAVVRMREELQALDDDLLLRASLIVLAESPWGSACETGA